MDLAAMQDLGGWLDDDQRRGAIIRDTLDASEYGVRDFYAVAPHLKGAGVGKTIELFRAFDLIGQARPYVPQTRGTCVGRGAARAADILEARQAATGKGTWLARISSEAVYGFARVEIGGGGGRGDGAVVAYALEAIARLGVLVRKRYEVGGKVYDLSGDDDDDLAAAWGARGVPDALEPEAHNRLIRAYAAIQNPEEARDALAGGYCLILGTSTAYWRSGSRSTRDARGFLTIRGRTAHCWIITGVADDGGRPVFCHDNRSWGDDWVDGPDGHELFPGGIPPGCFISTAEDFQRTIDAGECYAVADLGGFPAIDPSDAHLLC